MKLKSHIISTFSPAHMSVPFLLFHIIWNNSFHKINLQMLSCGGWSPYFSVNMQLQRFFFFQQSPRKRRIKISQVSKELRYRIWKLSVYCKGNKNEIMSVQRPNVLLKVRAANLSVNVSSAMPRNFGPLNSFGHPCHRRSCTLNRTPKFVANVGCFISKGVL
jgi:hypothetical protein